MIDYYEYSIPELVKLLGARFKDYRLRSNMTQKEVSEQSGITISTVLLLYLLSPDISSNLRILSQ